MTDLDALDERLRAVERAITHDDRDLTDLRDAAELTREVESLAERLDAAADRLDELDAATQALRGYVGNVRAVNETVERRADAALAKAEALEADRAADSSNRPPEREVRPSDPANRSPEAERTCDCERRFSERSNAPVESESRSSSTAHPRSASTAPKAADSDRADAALARVGRLLGLR